MSRIVVLDTETTCSNGERIVSISCVMFVNGVKHSEFNEYVKPVGWEISSTSTKIHGITNKFALANGKPIARVVHELYNFMNDVDLLVAHNIAYDTRVMRKEFERLGNTDALSFLVSTPMYCTMKEGRAVCKLLTDKGKPKNPKLDELHLHLFGEYFSGAHDARADTYACARCYFRMNAIEQTGDIEYKVQTMRTSPCQRSVVDVFESHNIIVDAVAGSGKTTTCLFAAQQYPNDKFLVLTYNKKLRDETRARINDMRIKNMKVYTFHGFCGYLYSKAVFNDTMLLNCIDDEETQTRPISFKRIIIDEAQDMRHNYFRFVRKVISLNKHPEPLLCVMGDEFQCIYDYAGADVRYLTLADKIFVPENTVWSKQHLSESFRVTAEMAGFVNNCMLGFDRIHAPRECGDKPLYLIDDMWEGGLQYVFDKIVGFISMGYKPEDIFVLGSSVKKNIGQTKPITMLSNKILRETSIPQHVQADDRDINERDIMNKIAFSSFHQSKGRERKIVILYDFDSFFYNPNDTSDKTKCPNILYVATTRAREHLILIHNKKNKYLPFLNVDRLHEFADVIKRCEMKYETKLPPPKRRTVTQLLDHIQDKTIIACMAYLRLSYVRHAGDKIDVATITPQKYENGTKGFEPVSDITGNAIPMYYQIKMQNASSVLQYIQKRCMLQPNMMKLHKHKKKGETCDSCCLIGILTDQEYKHIRALCVDDLIKNPSDLLRVATIWDGIQSMYLYRIKQISTYEWLTDPIIAACMVRMDSLGLSQSSGYEVNYVSKDKKPQTEMRDYIVSGFIDAVDEKNDVVYEFKCTSSLSYVHMIQLACYMYLREMNKPAGGTMSKYILYNILTDEMIRIEATIDDLKKMMSCLIDAKNEKHDAVADKKFVSDCLAGSTTMEDCDESYDDAPNAVDMAPINITNLLANMSF